MTADYSKLDAAILAAIEAKAPAPALGWRIERAVRAIAAEVRGDNALRSQPYEIVDRRRQALRKAGRIRYQRKPEGWVLVQRAVEIPEAGTNEA